MRKIIREALLQEGCSNCRYEHNLTKCEYCHFLYGTKRYNPTDEYVLQILEKLTKMEEDR